MEATEIFIKKVLVVVIFFKKAVQGDFLFITKIANLIESYFWS